MAREFPRRVMITGGAGFIGSAVIRHLLQSTETSIQNVDKLTYAGNLEALAPVESNKRYHLIRADICDARAMRQVLEAFAPQAIMHLAAETHVDRSIGGPAAFVETNINGTFTLLEAVRAFYLSLTGPEQESFLFHHVSTDEVYGSLGPAGAFHEQSRYDPGSPYSASKAASDHLVRAWHRTYGLPVVITNCSNNFGPYQYPEKFIPLLIHNALAGQPLPVYGSGENIRDWLYVEDHADALVKVLQRGRIGETYNIGGHAERSNIDVARAVCALLDDLIPNPSGNPHADLIQFVIDRPGHDHRYAIDAAKIGAEMGWRPRHGFEQGLRKTVMWYLENRDWMQRAKANCRLGDRLGLSVAASA